MIQMRIIRFCFIQTYKNVYCFNVKHNSKNLIHTNKNG